MEGTCACGCIMTNSSGEIIGTGRCKGLAEWNIRVDEGHIIKLSFQYFNLLVDEQRLRVRDGGLNGDLLGQSYGIIKLTKITSSSNKLLVQLMTRYNASIPLLYHRQRATTGNARERHRFSTLYSYGFIAFYSIEGNISNSSWVGVTHVHPNRSVPLCVKVPWYVPLRHKNVNCQYTHLLLHF